MTAFIQKCSLCDNAVEDTDIHEQLCTVCVDCEQYSNATETIENTADFYHSMFLEPDDVWRKTQWETALDILDRVRGQEEGTSLKNHLLYCDTCND
jgi:hypothetical protein